MSPTDRALHIAIFLLGFLLVAGTLVSAIATFVLPRSDRSFLTQLVFRNVRKLFNALLRFSTTYERSDQIMAYYAPLGLMLLLPTWYALIVLGYTAMYWALRPRASVESLQLSGSSLFT